ncbi:uncharacterized protein FOMMEDRAFT_159016 [Fomitiporia mediterranea MF3/22]|uniref:uncharacterized protein n=1 Tax=Fomitiporia mediterranea (strain MF3/22) TaxID=694068 RepID=UPI0004407E82|nr:uncharacterized protein FOMMEDRAFT_159016 [Fomitiporia mediterranea MF3/22]EJD00341.1 hypothetical protein FOMMEDRAFT_159016 [Fomitiporia mediterranea MF3/22]
MDYGKNVSAATLQTVVRNLRYAGYVEMSSMAVLVYDYIITFHDESSLMWPSPWSFPKFMFFLTRYLPFVDTSIVIWQVSTPDMAEADCQFAYRSTFWMLAVGICGAEAILATRTWAVYDFSWRIALVLCVSAFLILIPLVVVAAISVHSFQFATLPFHLHGCLIIKGRSYISYAWGLLAAFESIVLTLMVAEAIRVYKKHGPSYVFNRIYADGSLFYVYLFGMFSRGSA